MFLLLITNLIGYHGFDLCPIGNFKDLLKKTCKRERKGCCILEGVYIIKCEMLFGAGNLLNVHGFGSFNI
jgi:hypothetical protein